MYDPPRVWSSAVFCRPFRLIQTNVRNRSSVVEFVPYIPTHIIIYTAYYVLILYYMVPRVYALGIIVPSIFVDFRIDTDQVKDNL